MFDAKTKERRNLKKEIRGYYREERKIGREIKRLGSKIASEWDPKEARNRIQEIDMLTNKLRETRVKEACAKAYLDLGIY